MGTSPIEAEYNEIEGRNEWIKAYQNIKERSELQTKEFNLCWDESQKAKNRRLNRYMDVNPYDQSRIVLRRGDNDYINANLVMMSKANRKYILTQGPLQNTVAHFWLMVWEQNSKAILMLNKIIEKKQVKCHMYWPESKGTDNQMNLTDVGLIVDYLRGEKFQHYTKRVFRLTDTESNKSREVIQFHYNTWPDFGIPSSPIAFLQFLKQVRNSGALSADVGPAVVHCSAGIGRSGTFCLVDTCLVMVDIEGENKVSVQELLLELRRYRMGLIQTADQLYFSYKAIIEGIRHFNDPSFNDYEEVPVISQSLCSDADAVPPPVPPPRFESLDLGAGHQNSKPLPLIPCSVSANELDTDVRSTPEKTTAGNHIDRPLPPLPCENSLEKVDESASTDADDDDDDDDDDEEEDEDGDDNDEPLEGSDSSEVNSDINPMDIEVLPPSPIEKINANGGLVNVSSEKGVDSTEVRRRARKARLSVMTEKINEIKRKQRAGEEEAAARAPKKRRHLRKPTKKSAA